jgi:hypothetical protein
MIDKLTKKGRGMKSNCLAAPQNFELGPLSQKRSGGTQKF